jgi:hypothetical protein
MHFHHAPLAILGLSLPLLASCGDSSTPAITTPHVVGQSREEIGKYILDTAGCHDCHTPGVLAGRQLKDIPQAEILAGSPLGFNGPWGTTYAPNLRRKLAPYTEAMFIDAMRKRTDFPPMPWASLHAMADEDLGAVLAYIKSLGPSGNVAPDRLPAGVTPKQPFIVMVPGQDAAPTTAPANVR